MPAIDDPEKARRLARAIASDISLYNEEKIVKAIEKDAFFDELADELEEGKNLYMSRVANQIDPHAGFFYKAVVDIILRSKGHIQSSIWA